MSGTRIIAISAGDWAAGVAGFSLEEEGFFWRLVRLLYQFGGRLPDDDARNSRRMGLDPRHFRRLKDFLTREGKLVLVDGWLLNRRVARDIEAIEERRAEAAEAGRKGAATRRAAAEREAAHHPGEVGPTSPGLRPDFARTSPGLRDEVPPQIPEKTNEINDATMASYTPSPIREEEEGREVQSPKPPRGASDDSPAMPAHVKPVADWSAQFARPTPEMTLENGVLTLSEKTRSFWLGADGFAGDETALALALIEVVGRIQEQSRRPLVSQVNSQLARIARDRRDRDRRYREAAARNASARPTGGPASDARKPAWAAEQDERKRKFKAAYERLCEDRPT